MSALPLCVCGHRYDHHRHHAPAGCYECETCAVYRYESASSSAPTGSGVAA